MRTDDIKYMIGVMQSYLDGKEIEAKNRKRNTGWFVLEPNWNWEEMEYRVVVTKDSINWDHVAPKYKFMARDADGVTYIYVNKPEIDTHCKFWTCEYDESSEVVVFSSYKQGDCDWKDSLVERP